MLTPLWYDSLLNMSTFMEIYGRIMPHWPCSCCSCFSGKYGYNIQNFICGVYNIYYVVQTDLDFFCKYLDVYILCSQLTYIGLIIHLSSTQTSIVKIIRVIHLWDKFLKHWHTWWLWGWWGWLGRCAAWLSLPTFCLTWQPLNKVRLKNQTSRMLPGTLLFFVVFFFGGWGVS